MKHLSTKVISHLLSYYSHALGIAFRKSWGGLQEPLAAALLVVVTTGIVMWAGVFQPLELAIFDWFSCWQSPDHTSDRVVLVTASETDLQQLQRWPMSDRQLNQIIQIIESQQPRAIGLDLFRDLPVPPGLEELEATYHQIPHLIGVQKLAGQQIAPPPVLAELNQVGLADLAQDADGRVRRSILAMQARDGSLHLALALRLAMIYLAQETYEGEPITPKVDRLSPSVRYLGKATLRPLRSNSGGYVRLDMGGYQIFLNYAGRERHLTSVSLLDVLNNRVPPDFFRDRVVLIGVTAESANDRFLTPFQVCDSYQQRMSGVAIHAYATHQLIEAALGHRPLLQSLPQGLELGWVMLWTGLGAALFWYLAQRYPFSLSLLHFALQPFLVLLGLMLALGFTTYALFEAGWWIPLTPAAFAVVAIGVVITVDFGHKWRKIANLDGLTQIPNRRYFVHMLDVLWMQCAVRRTPLSVIMCDVDHFKQYNDCYGHLRGDACLRDVSRALVDVVRRGDFVARYGGEEFVVILPQADSQVAMRVAVRLCAEVRNLYIPHARSPVADQVTMSCGVASVQPSPSLSPLELVNLADRALYRAKNSGRNQAVLLTLMDDETGKFSEQRARQENELDDEG